MLVVTATDGRSEELYDKIGELTIERDFCRGGSEDEHTGPKALVDRNDGVSSIRRQCDLLGIARSDVYRPPAPANDGDLQ
jgi:putative transposase